VKGPTTATGTVADVAEPSPAQRHVFLRMVRFADIDSQGHVNNVRFLDYLEDARFGMFHIDPYNAGEQPFKGLVVTRHEIDYRRPLGFRSEPVRVETWVTEIRPVRFTLAYEIRDDEDLYVTATSVIVAYDVERAAPRRLTEDELVQLKRYTIQDQPS
jgi:acyl-CoA thioester hydrolase